MKKLVALVAAGSALVLSCVSAFAVESSYKATSANLPDTSWLKVGDFCGIGGWHPAVAKCVLSYGNKIRTLSLKGGGTIVERLLKWDDRDRSYSYTIVSGPLPVSRYFSTIKVVGDGKGSDIIWSGTYRAKGVSDAAAKKVIDGIYKAGADALAN